eukprot:TRINITY_DN774011_c0_g1_i1.p2 TRINITY_DN774011_c0_g1~~TRINITY_DN774011_c0_g1_i1.p2  ORF type:complete len:142 (-),score=19.77 TRINITY_DN774011_c0_g1_i1:362-787(-)
MSDDRADFEIKNMTIRDAENGALFWHATDWKLDPDREMMAVMSKEILESKAVSREVEFFSKNLIQDLSLIQNVFLDDIQIERWDFHFGFVIPNTTNTWQQTILADDETYPVELLDGRLVIETCFYSGDELISRSQVRVFYE